jgi:peptidoglycan hydrolase-like protein with peptidoglycan-binding domain
VAVDDDYTDAADFGQWPRPKPGPAPKPQPAPLPILKVGAKGAIVTTLQTLLTKKGSKIAIDGDFGPMTLAAVMLFQRQQKLTVDGIVGPATWAALRK